jgi:SRF-type transcription factor (DNA-binding and dimerisation domain).
MGKSLATHLHSFMHFSPATTPHTRPSRSISSRKAKRQKQYRRKSSLMKKACEYSKLCDAYVCLGIRLRETGQVFIFSADASGFWAFLGSQLVCCQHRLMERPLISPELTLSNAEAGDGSRSPGGLKRVHYSGLSHREDNETRGF